MALDDKSCFRSSQDMSSFYAGNRTFFFQLVLLIRPNPRNKPKYKTHIDITKSQQPKYNGQKSGKKMGQTQLSKDALYRHKRQPLRHPSSTHV